MKPTALACLLVLLLPVLTACGAQAGIEQPTASPQTTPINTMEVIELAELQPYRQAAVKGNTPVTWTETSESPQPASGDETRKQVQAAIKSEARRLAAVDYSALSIPAYVTITKTLKLAPDDFTGNELRLDSTGEVSGEKRWALYSWRGPDIPQLPNRSIVNRWVQVYALYDLKESKVVRLVATVRGEVLE